MRLAVAIVVLMLLVVAATHTTPRIEEDSPAWNCHTMGNHICGGTP